MGCVVIKSREPNWRKSTGGLASYSDAFDATTILALLLNRHGQLVTTTIDTRVFGPLEPLHRHAGFSDLEALDHGKLDTGNKQIEIGPRDRIIIPPYALHRLIAEQGRILQIRGLYIGPPGDSQKIMREIPPDGP